MDQYISFYHGRNKTDEDMDEWGFEGPVLGPIQISWTYGGIKIHEAQWGDFVNLIVVEDLCKIGDAYYGDFEVWTEDDELLQPILNIGESDRKLISWKDYKEITGQ